eukprot:Nk52_evm8s2171 gene=Nk52_evmTU8s2171
MIRAATNRFADIVICGAGISGIATAYYLSIKHKVKNIVLIDPRPPLSLTSSISTECYRDIWPRQSMYDFTSHSIDLMKKFHQNEGKKSFNIYENGYLFFSQEDNLRKDMASWLNIQNQDVRYVNSSSTQPIGAPGSGGIDLLEGSGTIQNHFPFLDKSVSSAVYGRNCGWINAHTMGMEMLSTGKESGSIAVVRGQVMHTAVEKGRISSLGIQYDSGLFDYINCGAVINAAGPYLEEVNSVVLGGYQEDWKLPLENSVHAKVMMKDPNNVIPNDAPVLITSDPVELKWSEEERSLIEDMDDNSLKKVLLNKLPGGAHVRKSGNDGMIFVWEHGNPVKEVESVQGVIEAQEDLQFHPAYPEVCVRSLMTSIPGLSSYIEDMPKSMYVDGGYYTHTPDNLPLIGKKSDATFGLRNYYLCGGLSGYGIMAAHGAGELLSDLVCNVDKSSIPYYAAKFDPSRFEASDYLETIEDGLVGQI